MTLVICRTVNYKIENIFNEKSLPVNRLQIILKQSAGKLSYSIFLRRFIEIDRFYTIA